MGFIRDALGMTNEYQAKPEDIFKTQYNPMVMGADQRFQAAQNDQSKLAQSLFDQMHGGGPNLAQQQLQMGTDAANRNAASLIGSQRGLNPALAARMVLDQQGQNQQQMAGQAALLRMQQQLGAQGQLGGLLGQQANQNLGMLGTAGGLQNQLGLGIQGINSGVAAQNAQSAGNIVGGLLGGAGSAAAAYAGKAHGGPIPGAAPLPGDSPINDIVPARLSPGEVVLPRSVTQSDDPEAAAAAFVRAIRGQVHRGGGFDEGGAVPDLSVPASAFSADPFARPMMPLLGQGGQQEWVDPAFALLGVPPPPAEAAPRRPESAFGVQMPPAPVLPPSVTSGAVLPPPPASGSALRVAGPTPDQFQAPAAAAAPKAAPAAPTAGGAPREFTQAQKAEQEAIQALGASRAAQAEHEARIADATAKSLEEMQAQNKALLADRQKAADAIFADYQSTKIDPNRYWASMGTGGKISSAIGLILGGIGAGLTHGPNMALQVIDKAIDRDIDAQKMELGKKANALSHYLQQTGDIRLAQQLAKADARDVAAAQMSAAALKYGGPQAQAQAQQMVAAARKQSVLDRQLVTERELQIKQMQLQEQSQRFQFQMMQGLASGADIDPKTIPFLPEHLRTLVTPVRGPGGTTQYALARTPKDAEEVTKSTEMTDTLREKLQRYGKFLVDHPKGISEILSNEDYNAAKALRESILTDINGLAGLTRLTDTEVKIFSDRLPDITKVQIGSGYQAKLGELAKDVDAKVAARNRLYLGRGR